MKLSRFKIQQMIDAGNVSNSRRGGGSGGGGGGGVSAQWVEEHYINKEFFSALFKILNGQGSSATEIEPNDTDTIEANPNTVNIEAMFTFWTEKAISALGQGSGGGGGGGGGATMLAQLTDVELTNLDTGDLLKYNGTHWVNITLATLMADYATKQWCNNNFIGSAAISDMATQSWVNQQGFVKNHPLSFWGQNWPTTNAAISGDMSNVGNITTSTNGTKSISGFHAITLYGATNGGHIDFFWNAATAYTSRISEGASGRLDINNTIFAKLSGNVGIGQASPSYKLDVSGAIHTTTGLLSDDYVTALSDIRFKDVVRKFTLSVDDIAGASLIIFTWKGRNDDRQHAGIIAQEWQKILPEAVVEGEDGRLAVDYGVIGAASAVSLARKVKEQQKEIELLKKKSNEQEKKMAEMEKRLARIEKMFALTEED